MIKIYTAVVNRPQFIPLQAQTFTKFLQNDFDFTVLDDSIDKEMTAQIKKVCAESGVNYHKIPTEIQQIARPNPGVFIGSYACAAGLQWAYNTLFQQGHEKILWLDSDMFLYDFLNVEEYLENCAISGLPQSRDHVKYFWNGLLFFNMKNLKGTPIDFFPQPVDGIPTDVGGAFYYFFKKHPEFLIKPIIHTSHLRKETVRRLPLWAREDYRLEFNIELLMDKFLHYGSGTNWPHYPATDDYLTEKGASTDPTQLKTDYLYKFITAALQRNDSQINPEWVAPTTKAADFITNPIITGH